MRCSSHCVARNYDLASLNRDFSHVYDIQTFKDALLLSPNDSQTSINSPLLIIFSYGCAVFWNWTSDDEKELLSQMNRFNQKQISHPVHETYKAQFSDKQSVSNDLILLDKKANLRLQMLTVSYALSQSAVLSIFEDRIWSTIELTKHLPQELCEKGRTSMSRLKLTKLLGRLFSERHSVNIHTDILDTPKFFWDNPEYESLYQMAKTDLSITARTNVLNTRLGIVHELLIIIKEELTNRHSSFLELIIIILIAMEVTLTLMLHVFKIL